MIGIASIWLSLALLLCAFAWRSNIRLIGLPLAVCAAAVAVYLPTGTPRFTAPPSGKYTVLGAKIEVDKAIYVLLDDGNGAPFYYVLPYSTGEANELQNAADTAGADGQVSVQIDGSGEGEFRGEPPVTGTDDKVAEQPEIQIN